MIMWLLRFAGSRAGSLVGIALVAGLIFYGLIQYGKNIQADQQELQRLRAGQETRERIDEEINNAPTDPVNALEWLRNR